MRYESRQACSQVRDQRADQHPVRYQVHAADLEGIDAHQVDGLRTVEIVVVADVAGVCAVEGGVVAGVVVLAAVSWRVSDTRLDVLPDDIHAVLADRLCLQLSFQGLHNLLVLPQRLLLRGERSFLFAMSISFSCERQVGRGGSGR